MTFSGPTHRLCMAAALTLALPCAGCWQEVHYQPPPETAAGTDAAGDGGGEAVGDEGAVAVAEPTAVLPTPPFSGPTTGELFAADPPPGTDAAAGPPPGADAFPPEIEPPTPIVVAAPDPPLAVAAPTVAERHAAWMLASDWALVAAMRANGLGAERYQRYSDAAREAGDALGVALPALPEAADVDKRVDAVIVALRDDAGPKLADALAARLDAAAGAAARLAIRAHLLLLTYSPAGSTVWSEGAAIRDAGVASELPPEIWRPLVEVLERRAPFLEVRKAVFSLREQVSAHLAD